MKFISLRFPSCHPPSNMLETHLMNGKGEKQLYYAKNKLTHTRSYIMGSMDQVDYNYERDVLSDWSVEQMNLGLKSTWYLVLFLYFGRNEEDRLSFDPLWACISWRHLHLHYWKVDGEDRLGRHIYSRDFFFYI